MFRKAVSLALLLLCLGPPSLLMAEDPKLDKIEVIEVKSLLATGPGAVAKAFKVVAKDSAGKGIKTKIKAVVQKGDAEISPNEPTLTDENGTLTFDITTKKDPVLEIQITPLASNETELTDKRKVVKLIPSPGQLKYIRELRTAGLTSHANMPDAILVTAKRLDDVSVPTIKIRASVEPGSDAQLYSDTERSSNVVGETDKDGVARFGILTNKDTKLTVRLTPLTADKETGFAEKVEIVELTGSEFVTSLGSKRAYLQLFLGQTFTNNYSTEDPKETNEHRSVGFQNAGPIIRLTLDTIWRRQKLNKQKCKEGCESICKKACTAGRCQNTCTDVCKSECETACTDAIENRNRQKDATPAPCTEGVEINAIDDREHSYKYGLWHTDANLEFSRFPFGKDAADIGKENEKGLKDAFSGTLGLTWQPNRFASYDQRDPNDLLPQDPQRYDAFRFGLFGKVGVTTRASSEPGGNSSVNRVQFGVRFTHSRSSHSNPVAEDRNEVPIRFVEVSYARFSDWGVAPTANDGASRLVIDAGLRITALSNAVFPIYAGAHLNTGPGPDDLRVFVGMLVKLDLLGRLVQGLAGAPPAP